MLSPDLLRGPIPGMSLTQEPGNMPWENPPELNTLQEVMEFFLEKTFDTEVENIILPVLEEGVSIETITDAICTSGTMNGRFSLDLAFLVNPYVRELLRYMADSAGIEFVDSYSDQEKQKIIPYRILKDLIKEIHEEEVEPKQKVETSMPKGLMSRFNKE
tara:strand:- start:13 stop:492 length:480 start_codon:yes stop_codon:yes gene_type:complete